MLSLIIQVVSVLHFYFCETFDFLEKNWKLLNNELNNFSFSERQRGKSHISKKILSQPNLWKVESYFCPLCSMEGRALHNAKWWRLVCTSLSEVNDVPFSSSRNCSIKMTEIIPNENAIVQKLGQEGREENWGKICFQFFKGNLKTYVRKEKKSYFNPNSTLC